MTLPVTLLEGRIQDALRRATAEGHLRGEDEARLYELLKEAVALAGRDVEEQSDEGAAGLGSKFEQAVRRFRRREGIG
jgi:hypothetical protein